MTTDLPSRASSNASARTLALLCSSKCPGTIVVGALDIAAALRDAPLLVVSGFQSPVERECLKVLLRANVKLVVCPARSAIDMRIPAAWKPAIAAGRLTIRSPFDEGWTGQKGKRGDSGSGGERQSAASRPKRATAATAEIRNRFVAAISDAVLILHASPGGKLDHFADELLAAGPESRKPLWTLDDSANKHLIARGAQPVTPVTAESIWASP